MRITAAIGIMLALFFCVGMAQAAMIAYYTFDNVSTDSTGSFSPAGTAGWGYLSNTSCKLGSCGNFNANATNFTVNITTLTGIGLYGSGNFTVNWWSAETTPAQNGNAWSNANISAPSAYAARAQYSTGADTGIGFDTVTSILTASASTNTPNLHMWTFMANNSGRYIYKDGVLNTSDTNRGFWGRGNFTFGWNSVNINNRLIGQIDEVSIHDRALTNTEVLCFYNNPGYAQALSCASGNFTITLKDYYNSTSIQNFNASINGTFYTTTTGSIETNISNIAANGTINVSINATNYFTNTSTVNASVSIASTIVPFTAIRVFPVGSSNPVTTFKVNATTGSTTTTYTTTSYIVYAPLFNTTYNLTLYDATNGTMNFSEQTANVSASPYLHSYNFSAYTTNTFNFTFRNETTNETITLTTYLELISDLFSANYSTSNGSLEINLLVPEDYKIIYHVQNSSVYREYYVTLTNQSYNNIILFVIDDSISQYFIPKVTDINGNPCGDQLVKLYRYYIDVNTYRVVEMAKSDTLGDAVLRVQPNTVAYKLQFTGTCGDFLTDPEKFTSSSNTYAVTDAQSVMTSITGVQNTTKNFTYLNSTLTFAFTYDGTTSNVLSEACLKVDMWNVTYYSTVYNNCTTGVAGSAIYTLTNTTTNYIGTATLKDSSGNIIYSDSLEAVFTAEYANFGLTGVYLTLIVLLLFLFLAGGSTETTVLGGVFAIFLMGAFGFIFNTYTTFIGIAIVAIIIAYKART